MFAHAFGVWINALLIVSAILSGVSAAPTAISRNYNDSICFAIDIGDKYEKITIDIMQLCAGGELEAHLGKLPDCSQLSLVNCADAATKSSAMHVEAQLIPCDAESWGFAYISLSNPAKIACQIAGLIEIIPREIPPSSSQHSEEENSSTLSSNSSSALPPLIPDDKFTIIYLLIGLTMGLVAILVTAKSISVIRNRVAASHAATAAAKKEKHENAATTVTSQCAPDNIEFTPANEVMLRVLESAAK
jgi:hypothetical protein